MRRLNRVNHRSCEPSLAAKGIVQAAYDRNSKGNLIATVIQVGGGIAVHCAALLRPPCVCVRVRARSRVHVCVHASVPVSTHPHCWQFGWQKEKALELLEEKSKDVVIEDDDMDMFGD